MTSRLQRTEAADLPRLAGIDQADLRDLRTPRPQVEVLPRTYDGHEAEGCRVADSRGRRARASDGRAPRRYGTDIERRAWSRQGRGPAT